MHVIVIIINICCHEGEIIAHYQIKDFGSHKKFKSAIKLLLQGQVVRANTYIFFDYVMKIKQKYFNFNKTNKMIPGKQQRQPS
ncbi:hypothetical protein BLA29_012904 [Euroglyphus maynei]|uniref:Uncharacterized protein n=1 Tax=Euroglyphus maynei TaxID=6958 RepID=A0A1Y3B9S5_EURMA|nr:hypothetical protein BLA29_012904 [Euroglyphus maynei]